MIDADGKHGSLMALPHRHYWRQHSAVARICAAIGGILLVAGGILITHLSRLLGLYAIAGGVLAGLVLVMLICLFAGANSTLVLHRDADRWVIFRSWRFVPCTWVSRQGRLHQNHLVGVGVAVGLDKYGRRIWQSDQLRYAWPRRLSYPRHALPDLNMRRTENSSAGPWRLFWGWSATREAQRWWVSQASVWFAREQDHALSVLPLARRQTRNLVYDYLTSDEQCLLAVALSDRRSFDHAHNYATLKMSVDSDTSSATLNLTRDESAVRVNSANVREQTALARFSDDSTVARISTYLSVPTLAGLDLVWANGNNTSRAYQYWTRTHMTGKELAHLSLHTWMAKRHGALFTDPAPDFTAMHLVAY